MRTFMRSFIRDRPRVLVVDGDLATRRLTCEILRGDGFEPVDAETGRDALDHFDRLSPDAVLLAIDLHGLDAHEVCRRLRATPRGAAIPVVVIADSDDVEAIARAFAAGATDFLTEPVDPRLLGHRMRYLLRAAAAAATERETAARLARAQRLARVVQWQLGDGDQITWSCDPLSVFWPDAAGHVPSGAAATLDQLLACVHPDDRDRLASLLAERKPHELDFRLQFPDGSERIVHQQAEVHFSEDGVMLIGATHDVTELRLAEQQIAQLAYYDDLTGIPNRQFIERYLRQLDPAEPRTAIAIDLGTGHLERLSSADRDLLIRAATARVVERVRGAELDVRLDQLPRAVEAFTGSVVVARVSADELAVITRPPDAGSAVVACQVAEALAAPFPLACGDVAICPRLGVADYPDPVRELRGLGDHARATMLEAERALGRNVVVLTAAAREQRARRAELAEQLAAALDLAVLSGNPDLTVEYVPRIAPLTRSVLGVRARPWWLVAADDRQLMAQVVDGAPALYERLARWTLEQAVRDASRWLAAGTTLRLAIEVPCRLVLQPSFADELQRLLADTKFEPLLLDLELIDLPATDGELDRLAGALRMVRALGVRIALAAMDDQRTIGELRRLPLDTLRVEHKTIERLGAGFLATVVAIARGLELRIAATEIDAPAALAAFDACELHELGGHLFGAAARAAGVSALAEQRIEQPHLPRHQPHGVAAGYAP